MLKLRVKQILKLTTFLAVSFFISGCTSERISEKLQWLDDRVGEGLENFQEEGINNQLDFLGDSKDSGEATDTEKDTQSIDVNFLTEEQESLIDQWLEENNFNRYGDAQDTIYAGGTPLFNEATGESIDRYKYIFDKHPEIINIFK